MLRGNFNEAGGRQVHQDDLRVLQDELLKAIQLQYAGQGAFILQGCQVTGSAGNYTIANGLVYINGSVMEFSSVSGITGFPKYVVQAADVDQDSFALEQGGSAYKRTLVKAELVSSAPGSGEFITMTSTGGRNYNDVLAAQFVRLSGNQTVNGQKTFSSDVISNGVNVNSAINNINSNLALKANSSVSITGIDGLYGGGNLTANRSLGLNNSGVTTDKLANASVTEIKLADNAVSSNKIQNTSITTSKIVNGSVTNEKLADNSIGASKIINGSITSDKLADGAINPTPITATVPFEGGSIRFTQWGKLVVMSGSFRPGSSNGTGSGSFSVPLTISAPAYATQFSCTGEGYFDTDPADTSDNVQYKFWGTINTNKTINFQTSRFNKYYYVNASYVAS